MCSLTQSITLPFDETSAYAFDLNHSGTRDPQPLPESARPALALHESVRAKYGYAIPNHLQHKKYHAWPAQGDPLEYSAPQNYDTHLQFLGLPPNGNPPETKYITRVYAPA